MNFSKAVLGPSSGANRLLISILRAVSVPLCAKGLHRGLSVSDVSLDRLRSRQHPPGYLPFSLRIVLVAHVEELEEFHLNTHAANSLHNSFYNSFWQSPPMYNASVEQLLSEFGKWKVCRVCTTKAKLAS